jgi:hypothetical protein
LVSIKNFFSLVTVSVIYCLFSVCEACDLGNNTLITFGLPSVDTIRKNNKRKNMISFSEEVLTSGLKGLLRCNFIS